MLALNACDFNEETVCTECKAYNNGNFVDFYSLCGSESDVAYYEELLSLIHI